MNQRDTDVMTVLRRLDPAPADTLSAGERRRADATFARIVATPDRGSESIPVVRPRRRRRVLAALALVGAAVVAGPSLVPSGRGSAFASWTPLPGPLVGAEAVEAATTCRAVLDVPDQDEQVVIGERRGGWTYVLLSGPRSEAACLMPDDLIGRPEARGDLGFFASYSRDPVASPAPPAARIDVTSAADGSVPGPGGWPWSSNDSWFNWVQGFVGDEVATVTVHPPGLPDVEATVSNGRFAAWWPSDVPSSETTDQMGAWTYTVTLVDGSTRESRG